MSGKRNTSIQKICAICNKIFYVKKYRSEKAKFCSRKCAAISYITKGKTNCKICGKEFNFISCRCNKAKYCSRECYYKSLRGKGKTEYSCVYCGKKFFDAKSRNRKYCSQKCINKISKEKWKPGYFSIRKYMINRNMIDKCQECGYDKEKSILGIHHIDKNRKNNDIHNLIVLCPNCHSLKHLKHIAH